MVLYCDHLLLRDDVAAEAADAEARAVQRQRRNDGVDARAVLQARVHDGLRFVDAAADLRDDLFDDVQQVRVVLEPDGGLRQLAVPLDEDLVVAVDQDVRDGRLLEQRSRAGPSPSTSSSTSSTILVCSAVVIGTRSSSSRRSTTRPISARTRSLGMEETRSRLRTPISLRWICDFSSKYRSAARLAIGGAPPRVGRGRLLDPT